MPSDEWAKSKAKRKAAGRTFEVQEEYQAARDKSVDAWIAAKEAETATEKPKPKKKKKRR